MVTVTDFEPLGAYRFADFELRLGPRQLQHRGIPCHLEPRTYDLLRHLLEARDRVVTKEELLDVVWQGTAVCSGAVCQCISVLRKTLGDTGRQQRMLKTFPRIGYRFVCRVEPIAPVEIAAPPSVSWQVFRHVEAMAAAAQ